MTNKKEKKILLNQIKTEKTNSKDLTSWNYKLKPECKLF